jgi:hypothetical protein
MIELSHITGLDVFFAILALLILIIIYLIIQLTITIVFVRNKVESSVSIFQTINAIIAKVKGKT